ncbi:uncharacterized protein BT62DRAFT_929855 [Guyanagaster necrorhizus]|uniref:CST complex subunit STN1 n=1 Tax=Guyanagaster necrorhizus TaxID=856835 RepID=A0A9P7VYV0_9AGAR|nr:uncharacterized protein BT62DRAFT_929855 [Guyanagaster necrorhizus MCA 3950]KAG7448769.1 hypothetical protein BT62DRAFT_929855 [Guyanagaster necrorhizus MCA 3950]
MPVPSLSSLWLTPAKKMAAPMVVQPAASASTSTEIYNWTYKQAEEATILCFVRDIHAMTQHIAKDETFFWLGKVPCRRVNFVGIVVGVQDTGKRIKISVDDGTAVIDCIQSITSTPTPTPACPLSSPKPTALPAPNTAIRVGHLVRVKGKIEEWHDTKEIKIDDIGSIEQCKSFNEEPLHWQRVSSLHKTYYSSQEPFVIPSATNDTQNQDVDARMSQPSIDAEYFSPIQESQTPRSPQSPHKFKHPSRLPSSQLTDNTFRLYLQYYMQNPPHATSHARSIPDTYVEPDSTLRPRNHHLRTSSDIGGFTLSYLRRVPELSNMAKLVVLADIKKSRRKEREAAKESSQSLRKSQKPSRERLGPKKKQLFIRALVELMKEGSIIVWDGPNHPLSTASLLGPWKSTSAHNICASTGISSTAMSSTSISTLQEDDDPLSDPEPTEESYVPSTPQYTAEVVEKAMVKMNALPPDRRRPLNRRTIAGFLQTTDDRWKNLGDWAVQDALEFLRTKNRVRFAGTKGNWELCP